MLGAQKRCEKCGGPAVYKFTRFINGKPVDRFYCEDHAAEASNYVQKQASDIKEFLKSVAEGMGEAAAAASSYPDIHCSSCGLSFEAYKKTLLLGCPECYRSFEEQMMGELRKFHGETRHIGRAPSTMPTPHASIPEILDEPADYEEVEITKLSEQDASEASEELSLDELRRQLKEAVSREDFADAARYRDQIRLHEQKRPPVSTEE